MLERLLVSGTVGCACNAEHVGRLVMTDEQSGSIGANEDECIDERERCKGKEHAAATARPPGPHGPFSPIAATSTSTNSVSGNRGTLNYWKTPLHLAWSTYKAISS